MNGPLEAGATPQRPALGARTGAGTSPPGSGLKQRTAALSVLSNSGLILLKVIAGTIPAPSRS
jgi:hypothetical protein